MLRKVLVPLGHCAGYKPLVGSVRINVGQRWASTTLCGSLPRIVSAPHRSSVDTMSNANNAAATQDSASNVPEVPAGMELDVQLLEALADIPSISKLTTRQAPGSKDTWLTLHMSQRNLAANNSRKYVVHAVMAPNGGLGPFSLPLELPDSLIVSCSPSGHHQLVIKAGVDNISLVHQLWSGSRMVAELQVPKTVHGALCNDGYFANGVVWSPDSSAVAYVVDAPPVERTPSWGGPEGLKDAAGVKGWRGVGAAVEDWGELNTGKRGPVLFVLDVRQRKLVKVGGVPADLSCGQPVWTRDSGGVLFVGWPSQATNFPKLRKRLGVVYCYNRPCHLYHVPISRDARGELSAGAAAQKITPALDSAHSPIFTPNGQHLLFASYQAAVDTGTHNAGVQLYKMPWPQALHKTATLQLVVGLVDDPAANAPAGGPDPAASPRPFPGLFFTGALLEDAFIDNSTLLLTSQWYSQTAVLAINIDSGSVTPITPVDKGPLGCWTLLGQAAGRVFASQVAPDTPPRLMAADLPHGASPEPEHLEWTSVGPNGQEVPQRAALVLAGLEYRVLQVAPTCGGAGPSQRPFETIVLAPRGRKGPLPTVLAPHGGPHTAVVLGWYMPYAYLAHLGYAVVLPNYRGSTGFGQGALQCLPGHVGHHDVEDCMAALRASADAGFTDLSRVAMCGGSHGGFLTGHLVGQYPEAFKCGIMRNPVCNLSLMIGISDIPDWVYVETFGCEEGRKRCSGVTTPEDLRAFFEASPIAHVHKVKAPMLFLLGAKDRRVPLADGLQYIAALRAQEVPVRVLTFPEDSHALDKPQTEFEQWVNVAWWLKSYL